MKITMVGTGYVGLVTGACLAEAGNEVLCLDIDEQKVAMLRDGRVPIFEPGLEEMVRRGIGTGRLRFTTNVGESVEHGALQFIAVGTPPDEDGSADLKHVLTAARNIGRHMTEYRIIVNKSTVPVGTADLVHATIAEELTKRGVKARYSVVSNPEFLKEGAAVEDFMKPDRIVVGSDDARATEIMRTLYGPFHRNHERMLVMDVRSAELTKYASNAMLATRISFMNELANLAERLGVDIEQVRKGIGSDPRIGYDFLYAGTGYGGSCFPKDVKALQSMARQHGLSPRLLAAVDAVNEAQKQILVRKVVARFGERLDRRQFALWGLAFKPNTDDMREAPSRVVVQALTTRGAAVVAYDPAAEQQARQVFGRLPALRYASSPVGALDGADALIIATEWKEFRSPDFQDMRRRMRQPVIFDGRNLYDPALLDSLGFEYHGIGRGASATRVGPQPDLKRSVAALHP